MKRKLPAPDVVRHLASSTSVYQTMIQDALTSIEGAMVEYPEVTDDYLEVSEHLRVLLDKNEMGSLPAILRCCQALLGEASA